MNFTFQIRRKMVQIMFLSTYRSKNLSPAKFSLATIEQILYTTEVQKIFNTVDLRKISSDGREPIWT